MNHIDIVKNYRRALNKSSIEITLQENHSTNLKYCSKFNFINLTKAQVIRRNMKINPSNPFL